jgi:hypothetical protein
MAITISQGLMKLFLPTWQCHHLMIASTVVPFLCGVRPQMSLTARQHGKAYLQRDASLLQCTLRDRFDQVNEAAPTLQGAIAFSYSTKM